MGSVITDIETAVADAYSECQLLEQSGIMPASDFALATLAFTLAETALSVLGPIIPSSLEAVEGAPESRGKSIGYELFNAHLKNVHDRAAISLK